MGTRIKLPIVIVMPVYEDRKSASRLLQDVAAHFPGAPHIVAVDDGSARDQLRASDISDAGLDGDVVYLVRNMGHQRAIATGLAYVNLHFDPGAVVVMDADGEDRPDAIEPLLRKLETANVDVVVAIRRKRRESLQFRIFYILYRLIFQALTGRSIRFGNFIALSAFAVRRLAAMQEMWVHFAASLLVSRLRIGAVPTDRGKRYFGESHMDFSSLMLHGLRSIIVFADDVLVRVGLFSMVLAGFAIALLFVPLGLKLMDFATPGWFSIASGILILIVMQAGGLTFATLMVSGIMRSAPPITRPQLDLLIERVESTARRAQTPIVAE